MLLLLKNLFLVVVISLLIAVSCLVLLIIAAKGGGTASYNFSRLKPLLICFFCTIFIFIESLFLVGAFRVRIHYDRVIDHIETLVGTAQGVTHHEFSELIGDYYPELIPYLSVVQTEIDSRYYAVEDLLAGIRRKINRYILRRFLWMFGVMAAGGALLVRDAQKESRRALSASAYLYSDDD